MVRTRRTPKANKVNRATNETSNASLITKQSGGPTTPVTPTLPRRQSRLKATSAAATASGGARPGPQSPPKNPPAAVVEVSQYLPRSTSVTSSSGRSSFNAARKASEEHNSNHSNPVNGDGDDSVIITHMPSDVSDITVSNSSGKRNPRPTTKSTVASTVEISSSDSDHVPPLSIRPQRKRTAQRSPSLTSLFSGSWQDVVSGISSTPLDSPGISTTRGRAASDTSQRSRATRSVSSRKTNELQTGSAVDFDLNQQGLGEEWGDLRFNWFESEPSTPAVNLSHASQDVGEISSHLHISSETNIDLLAQLHSLFTPESDQAAGESAPLSAPLVASSKPLPDTTSVDPANHLQALTSLPPLLSPTLPPLMLPGKPMSVSRSASPAAPKSAPVTANTTIDPPPTAALPARRRGRKTRPKLTTATTSATPSAKGTPEVVLPTPQGDESPVVVNNDPVPAAQSSARKPPAKRRKKISSNATSPAKPIQTPTISMSKEAATQSTVAGNTAVTTEKSPVTPTRSVITTPAPKPTPIGQSSPPVVPPPTGTKRKQKLSSLARANRPGALATSRCVSPSLGDDRKRPTPGGPLDVGKLIVKLEKRFNSIPTDPSRVAFTYQTFTDCSVEPDSFPTELPTPNSSINRFGGAGPALLSPSTTNTNQLFPNALRQPIVLDSLEFQDSQPDPSPVSSNTARHLKTTPVSSQVIQPWDTARFQVHLTRPPTILASMDHVNYFRLNSIAASPDHLSASENRDLVELNKKVELERVRFAQYLQELAWPRLGYIPLEINTLVEKQFEFIRRRILISYPTRYTMKNEITMVPTVTAEENSYRLHHSRVLKHVGKCRRVEIPNLSTGKPILRKESPWGNQRGPFGALATDGPQTGVSRQGSRASTPGLSEGAKRPLSSNNLKVNDEPSAAEPDGTWLGTRESYHRQGSVDTPPFTVPDLPQISQDPSVHQLAAEHLPNISVTLETLCTLLTIRANLDQSLDLPLTVVETTPPTSATVPNDPATKSRPQRQVFIDNPWTPAKMSWRERNQLFYDDAVRAQLCTSEHITCDNMADSGVQNGDAAAARLVDTLVQSAKDPHKSTPSKADSPDKPTSTLLRNTMYTATDMESVYQDTNLQYGLWEFGPIKLLIRNSFHGFVSPKDLTGRGATNDGTRSTGNCYVNLGAKLEYQADHGLEIVTDAERAYWWLMTFLSGNAQLLLVRINPLDGQLLQCKLYPMHKIIPDGRWPAPFSQFLYHVLSALNKLPPGRYVLRHRPQEWNMGIFAAQPEQSNTTGSPMGSSGQPATIYNLRERFATIPLTHGAKPGYIPLSNQCPPNRIPNTIPQGTHYTPRADF
ncbi:hypothetical protein IWQ62_001549 [Dispira parvispora]|uniref:Little elongation complex subunit 2 C-terminal domain-containing protein n=1 Tax=Dispira parvispora TaxID=1520584 RepID=A0A9W8E4T7_9FUNG|nr:hypothetical protein IWQ62_001549 [Dispira parvispora]